MSTMRDGPKRRDERCHLDHFDSNRQGEIKPRRLFHHFGQTIRSQDVFSFPFVGVTALREFTNAVPGGSVRPAPGAPPWIFGGALTTACGGVAEPTDASVPVIATCGTSLDCERLDGSSRPIFAEGRGSFSE
jgi:hypothetical protein